MARHHPPLTRRHSAGVDSYVNNDELCETYLSRRLAPLALADNMSSRQSVAYSSYSRRTPTGETVDEGFGGRSSRCSLASDGSWGSSASIPVRRQRGRLSEDVIDEIIERVRRIPHCSQSLLGVVHKIAQTHDASIADSMQTHEMMISDGLCTQPSRPIRPSPTWRSADLQVVEALQELYSLKAGVFDSPDHQRCTRSEAATVTYEIVQTNFKQSEYMAYATVPGGSCYGSLQACATRGEARRSAACVALVHAAWNELPSKTLTEGNIEGLVMAAKTSKLKKAGRSPSVSSIFSNPPSLSSSCAATPTHLRTNAPPRLQKQSSISSATSCVSYDSGCSSGSIPGTPITPCMDMEEASCHLPGPLSSNWQAVDILRHLLKMYCGRTAMEFRERMTVFQLMQWSGDLQRAKSRCLAFESVLQAYLSTPLDEKLRTYLSKMWARKEGAERGIITQALKNCRRELDTLRVSGSEVSFAKEKKSILVNAFALYQRQQATVRHSDYQAPLPPQLAHQQQRMSSRVQQRGRSSSRDRGDYTSDWYCSHGQYS
eukprot:scpid60472/ scgid5686/ Protein limb expression 1